MSLSSTVTLGSLRLQAQQRADLEGSSVISTPEWNQYISQSYKRLYDMLIAAYGNDYSVASPYQFSITGTQLYSLPTDFYKLLGVDIASSASLTGWLTLKKFEFIDRNKYSFQNPLPIPSSTVQLWYIPEPTSLQFQPLCSTTLSSTTIGIGSYSSAITAGMSVSGSGIPAGTTIVSVNTTLNTAVLSVAATSTQARVTLSFWIDSTTVDGISGWEEYIIVDAAIKANVKQEFPVDDLRIQKAEMVSDIQSMAEGRDAGQAHHVSDVLSVNTPIGLIGAANLKYRLLGSQIQFIPCGSDDYSEGFGYGGSYGF